MTVPVFPREVLAALLAQMLAALRLPSEDDGAAFEGELIAPTLAPRSEGGSLGAPRSFLLAALGVLYPLADENPNRIRFVVQNHGPGHVFLTPDSKGVNVTIRDGIMIQAPPVGEVSTFIDELPRPHTGRWYAMTSVTNTRITVAEVGPAT